MNTSSSNTHSSTPFLRAFHIFWAVALQERKKILSQQQSNGSEKKLPRLASQEEIITNQRASHSEKVQRQNSELAKKQLAKRLSREKLGKTGSQDSFDRYYVGREVSFDSGCDENVSESSFSDLNDAVKDVETVVVCTLDCDDGARFVRQIVYDNPDRSDWSRAEFTFVDWLRNDLTPKTSEKIKATMYFCALPSSMTCDGIGLWLRSLIEKGKETKVSIKFASVGRDIGMVSQEVEDGCREFTITEDTEQDDAEIIEALKRLQTLGVSIEFFNAEDWEVLMKLLMNKQSLQALDMSKNPSAETLSIVLQQMNLTTRAASKASSFDDLDNPFL